MIIIYNLKIVYDFIYYGILRDTRYALVLVFGISLVTPCKALQCPLFLARESIL